MLTVAQLGATGYMGSGFSKGLLKASRANALRYVILHRPGADLSRYPQDVEKRVIDIEGGVQDVRDALSGVQVVMASLPGGQLRKQFILLEALQGSPDLVTFFPTEYATPMTEEESRLLSGPAAKANVMARAEELSVPITILKNATTPDLLFGTPPFSRFIPKTNNLELYVPLGKGKRGLTSSDFSGDALVHLLLHRLQDLPNRTFSLVELQFSSSDLIDEFTKLHGGTTPTIKEYTETQYQAALSSGEFGAVFRAAGTKGLARGVSWPGEIIDTFEGWQRRSLGEYIAQFA